MGWGKIITCEDCIRRFAIGDGRPFFRDENGQMQYYGHPVASDEAIKAGIYGIYDEYYCPDCNEVFKIIINEYETPIGAGKNMALVEDMIGAMQLMSKEKEEEKCPKCDRTLDKNLKDVTCRGCGNPMKIVSFIS